MNARWNVVIRRQTLTHESHRIFALTPLFKAPHKSFTLPMAATATSVFYIGPSSEVALKQSAMVLLLSRLANREGEPIWVT